MLLLRNKHAQFVFDLLRHGDYEHVKPIIRKNTRYALATESMSKKNVLEFAFNVVQFENNWDMELICQVCQIEHCQIGTFLLHLVHCKMQQMVKHVLQLPALGVIDKESMEQLMIATTKEVFDIILQSNAEKRIDMALKHAILSPSVNGQALVMACAIKTIQRRLTITNIVPFIVACVTMSNVQAAKLVLENLEYEKQQLVDACVREQQVFEFMQTVPIINYKFSSLDALLNEEFDAIVTINMINGASHELGWRLCQAMTKRNPCFTIPLRFHCNLSMAHQVKQFVQGHGDLYTCCSTEFLELVQLSGYKWKESDIARIFMLNPQVNSSLLQELSHVAISSATATIAVEQDNIEFILAYSKNHTIPATLLLSHAISVEMVQLLISRGAQVTPAIVANSATYNVFSYFVDHFYVSNEELQRVPILNITSWKSEQMLDIVYKHEIWSANMASHFCHMLTTESSDYTAINILLALQQRQSLSLLLNTNELNFVFFMFNPKLVKAIQFMIFLVFQTRV